MQHGQLTQRDLAQPDWCRTRAAWWTVTAANAPDAQAETAFAEMAANWLLLAELLEKYRTCSCRARAISATKQSYAWRSPDK
jgi:hypothetical protein